MFRHFEEGAVHEIGRRVRRAVERAALESGIHLARRHVDRDAPRLLNPDRHGGAGGSDTLALHLRKGADGRGAHEHIGRRRVGAEIDHAQIGPFLELRLVRHREIGGREDRHDGVGIGEAELLHRIRHRHLRGRVDGGGMGHLHHVVLDTLQRRPGRKQHGAGIDLRHEVTARKLLDEGAPFDVARPRHRHRGIVEAVGDKARLRGRGPAQKSRRGGRGQ